MSKQPAPAAAFPRSTRAIHADSLAPGLAILIILMLVLVGWLLWLVLFKVPFYEISQSAQVTPDATIVAEFSGVALSQIQFGQAARFVPQPEAGTANGQNSAVTATVVDIDTAEGLVWLVPDRAAQSRLYTGLSGQVFVVIREQSPFSLIIEAVGLHSSA